MLSPEGGVPLPPDRRPDSCALKPDTPRPCNSTSEYSPNLPPFPLPGPWASPPWPSPNTASACPSPPLPAHLPSPSPSSFLSPPPPSPFSTPGCHPCRSREPHPPNSRPPASGPTLHPCDAHLVQIFLCGDGDSSPGLALLHSFWNTPPLCLMNSCSSMDTQCMYPLLQAALHRRHPPPGQGSILTAPARCRFVCRFLCFPH